MSWYYLFKLSTSLKFLLDQKIPQDIAQYSLSISPTYAWWISKLVLSGTIRKGEDDQKLQNTLKQFDRLKRIPSFPHKDIMQFSNYGDLVQALEPYLQQYSKRETGRIQETEGLVLLLNKPPYQVYRLDTAEAASKMCRDTEWCVKDPKWYNEYVGKGPLYLVIKDGEKFALVNYESGQFMNKYDNRVSPDTKFKLINLLAPITGKTKENDARLAYDYVVSIVGREYFKRYPPLEDIIASNAHVALQYAEVIINGKFPQAEKIIRESPVYSLEYALYVLKGRFPEGEAAIAKEDHTSYMYAKNVIKGRFPE